MKLYKALAQTLADHETETLFGVVGDPSILFIESFVRDFNGTFIAGSHEVGATLMAQGYGATSDKLAVVSVTHGPGLVNSLTGVVDAVKARMPMLVIYPDTAAENHNHRQNVPQREFIMPTGAGFEQARSPRTTQMDMAVAIRRAFHERRPIALNIPREFFNEEVEYERIVLPSTPNPGWKIDEEVLDEAVGLIASARRPIVVGGRGAQASRAQLLRLAERIGAPLANSIGGKDLFRGEPFDLGIMGTFATGAALETFAESDCIIAFGVGLNQDTTAQGSLLAGKRVVHCDNDPERLGRFSRADVAILGDAGEVADVIVKWLDEADVPATSFRSAALAERLARPEEHAGPPAEAQFPLDVRVALREIDAAVPTDKIYVTDPGRHLTVTWTEVHVKHSADFVLTASFGAIGTGLAIAIGAGIGDRTRPVLFVGGDGGFMLAGNEFTSAVRYGVDLIVVVCNDQSYGAEHQILVDHDLPPELVECEWPDLAPLADALGGQGVTVRTVDDLPAVREAIANRTRPLLIDLKLDALTMPRIPH